MTTEPDSLVAENERLREAFAALLEEARDMRSYVPDYFAKKWHHDEALEAAQTALGIISCVTGKSP